MDPIQVPDPAKRGRPECALVSMGPPRGVSVQPFSAATWPAPNAVELSDKAADALADLVTADAELRGDTRRKLYLSGPIKGVPNASDQFRAAENALWDADHEPVNPFDCAAECGYSEECPGAGTDAHYDHFLRGDLIEMLACDGVALLDGWEASRGARIEHTVAVQVGLPVRTLSDWLTA